MLKEVTDLNQGFLKSGIQDAGEINDAVKGNSGHKKTAANAAVFLYLYPEWVGIQTRVN